MLASIVKRDGRVVPFVRDKISFAIYRAAVAVGGRDRAVAETVTDVVVALLERATDSSASADLPTVEDVQDAVEKALIERGHARTAKAYIIYRYEHALKREGKRSLAYSFDNIPYKALWETLSWATDHRCARLADLAEWVPRLDQLIDLSERFYARQVEAAVDALSALPTRPRVVVVAGPSSSGKTTTTLKVREALEAQGQRLFSLQVDNYFFDLATHPRDHRGDYDFESPQAIDLALINQHLHGLLSSDDVALPHYDFRTGKRTEGVHRVQLEADTVVVIDSLHGLYPQMTDGLDPALRAAVYVETLSQLKTEDGGFVRWADLRLLRRMVRDAQFRNYDPRQTLLHWHHVRRAEMRYIVPRLHTATAIINTWLPYELPVLKARLGDQVTALADELVGHEDPDSDDARSRITRVRDLLAAIPAAISEDGIPSASLMREFIGGSSYEY